MIQIVHQGYYQYYVSQIEMLARSYLETCSPIEIALEVGANTYYHFVYPL